MITLLPFLTIIMSTNSNEESHVDEVAAQENKDDDFTSIESAVGKHKDCLVEYHEYLSPQWDDNDLDMDSTVTGEFISILAEVHTPIGGYSDDEAAMMAMGVFDPTEVVPYIEAHNHAYFEGYRKAFKSNIEELLKALKLSVREQVRLHISDNTRHCRKLLRFYEDNELRWLVDAVSESEGGLRGYMRSSDLGPRGVLVRYSASVMNVCRYYDHAPGPWRDIYLCGWLLHSALPCWSALCAAIPGPESSVLESVTPIASHKRGGERAPGSPYNPTDYSDMDVTVNKTLDLTMSEDGDGDSDVGSGSRGRMFGAGDAARKGAKGNAAAVLQTNRHQLSEINRLNSEIYRLTALLEDTSSSDLVSVEEKLRVTTMQLHRVQAHNNELKSRVQALDAQCHELRMAMLAQSGGVAASSGSMSAGDEFLDSDDDLAYEDPVAPIDPNAPAGGSDGKKPATDEEPTGATGSTTGIPKGIIKRNKFLLGSAGGGSKKVSISTEADKDPLLRERMAGNKSNKSDLFRPLKDKEQEEIIMQFESWTPAAELITSLQKLGTRSTVPLVPKGNPEGKKGVKSVAAATVDAADSGVALINEVLKRFNDVIMNSVSNDRRVMKQMSLEIEKLSAQLALSELGEDPRAPFEPVEDVTSSAGVQKTALDSTQYSRDASIAPAEGHVVEGEVGTERKARVRARKRGSMKEYSWESLLCSFIGGVMVMLLCSALVQLRYSNMSIPEFIPTSKPGSSRTTQSRPFPGLSKSRKPL